MYYDMIYDRPFFCIELHRF